MKDELSYAVIGSAMTVHSTLGFGYQEVIYQRALAIEMARRDIDFQRELPMQIHYAGEHIGNRRVDFFVEGRLMLELKAVRELEDIHRIQIMNYCQMYGLPSGLLINFGARKLEFERIYNTNLSDTAIHLVGLTPE
ncbi:GxxExxY protein [Lewinella sp. W8]|uniref:GxxExxY protein n=1 Tax=Lewinella sp. W8 TaxID=2528208 RepID=UPI001067275E|nr:GxxExxY protein [Lewinella sp. W8]MTB50756.1 GxxExxY protein [Lewinella sp. W8]